MSESTLYAIIAILTLLLSSETAYIIKAVGKARAAKQEHDDRLMQKMLAEIKALRGEKK